MRIETMHDARAEMARHRVTRAEVAARLGIGVGAFSIIVNSDLVDLTPAGAARIADAIETCAAGVAA